MLSVLRAAAVLSAAFFFFAPEGWALITVGALDTPDRARGVGVADDLVYVADNTSGLRVIDVSDPALPVEIGNLLGDYYDIEAVGAWSIWRRSPGGCG